ncbi:glycosyltransferase [Chloroflexota bacterium]
MRICYLANAASIHTQRWVNYFVRKGHEVHLISFRFTDGLEKRVVTHQLNRLPPERWQISKYPSGILALLQIRKLLKKIGPDILDAHYISLYGYFGTISSFHPLILTAWGSDILTVPKRNFVHRFFVKQALKRADGIICVSTALKREIIDLGGSPDKIKIIFIGIDTEEFSPKHKSKITRQRLGIFDSPLVISIRSLSSNYDVETLVRAIPLVLEEAPQAKFIIAGEGEQRAYLRDLTQSLGVSDNTKFVGWISHNELPDYLASSDVYVSTSLSDGTSQSLLEAMSCGLAPVITNIPANQLWIKDGENGFLVPTKDYKTLAAKITYLVKNREIIKIFGKASRSIVIETAEHKKEMARVEKMYEGLLSGKTDQRTCMYD